MHRFRRFGKLIRIGFEFVRIEFQVDIWVQTDLIYVLFNSVFIPIHFLRDVWN